MNRKIIIFGLIGTIILTMSNGSLSFAGEMTVEEAQSIVKEMESIKGEILELTLQGAIDYALENSKQMLIQDIELEKAELAYRQNRNSVNDQKDIMDLPIPRMYEVTPDDNVNRALIRNGGAMKQVELVYDMSKWNYETTENQIRYNVEKAYFDLLQMEKELDIAEENLALATKQYDHGKLRFDVGMISQQQLLGLELSLSQAQSGYDNSVMYYELQRMSFKNTIGLPLEDEFELTDSIEVEDYETIVLEDSIGLAIENNSNIMVAERSLEIHELTLQATLSRFPPNTYRYRTQVQEVLNAEMNLQNAKTGVEMQVRSAVLNLTTAEKQIATFEKAVFQASEGVRIAELSFELGQNTATEVGQANLNLMNAKKNLAQQIHAFNMALLDYKYSIGIGKGF
ncbi:TolC family protein [Gudongella sp. SC589]|jgi:outer membrane protein TolC|uniref:TolC family protein n=1 Tax=Gudongella sp. SC589 TaxID=3385990 RepID=UPI003904A4E1